MKEIECNQVVKKFGDFTAVKGVSLSVEKGEMFGLLGVNGAGKTTLIRILSTLSLPTGGSARVGGYDVVKQAGEVKRIIDVSPQETSIAPNLTVRENLYFFASVYGLTKRQADETIQEIAEVFRLEEVMGKRAKTLSGGWARRLSIAIALVSSPQVLFLDEPTLGLDVLARRELWRVIEKLKGKITIVLTSHYLEEIEALCDRVAVMAKGEVAFTGTVEEIKAEAGEEKFEDAFVKIVEKSEERKYENA